MKRSDDRKAGFKKGVDAEEGRRRRDETRLQIRKTKKEEQLAKRRHANGNADFDPKQPDSNVAPERKVPTLADLPLLVQKLSDPSSDNSVRVNSVRGIRRMLSVEQNPPIRQVISTGVISYLVRSLSVDECPELQFEAAWALTNVASTEFTQEVVKAGAIPFLAPLLECRAANVREQAAWCLGNISGDCPEFRDLVLRAGVLPSLLKNIQHPETISLLGNVVWTISNLCRGKPQPELNLVKDCVPALAYVIPTVDNAEIIADAVWALSYLSDGDDYRIQAVIDGHVIPLLITIIDSNKSTLLTPAVRTLGNIVTGNEKQTQLAIDAGILGKVMLLLQHARKNIRKETCWLLSNIAAGNEDQIGALFKVPGLVPRLVELARVAEWEVRKEALWAVSNIFTGGSTAQIQKLVDMDGMEAMCEVLELQDTRMLFVALDAIESLLRDGEKHGKPYKLLMEECDGISKIENLQQHNNDNVYEKVLKIIDEFFGVDDEEDENLAPTTDGNSFAFGIPSKKLFGSPQPAGGDTLEAPSGQFNFGGTNNNNGFNFGA